MTVPHPKYLLNLNGLDPVTAAPYACSGVTTYSALKKVENVLHTPIVIFGAGGLGLMALSLLKAMGGKGAIMGDIDARKREAAEAAGALATLDRKTADGLEQRQKQAGGPDRTKKIAPIPVTTMPLAKANEALTDLQKGKLVGRAVLTP